MRNIIRNFFSYTGKRSNNIFLDLINRFYKIIQYILNNPRKTLVLGLLGQVSLNNANNASNVSSASSFDYLDTLSFPQNFSSHGEEKENFSPILSFDHYQIDNLKSQIIELKTWLKKQVIFECVFSIREENLKISKFKWNSMSFMNKNNQWHESDVQKIVKEAYGDNLDYFYKINNFIQKSLSNFKQKIVGYETLLQELERNDHLTASTIMMLNSKIQSLKNYSDYQNMDSNYQNKFNDLETQLNQYEVKQKEKESIMSACIAAIRIENSMLAKIKCQETKTLNKNNQWNDEDIQSIVLKLYADNSDNFWKTDQFIRYELPYMQNEVTAYEALIGKMKLINHFQTYEVILLNSRIQEYKKRLDYLSMSKKYKNKLESMESLLELQSIKLELKWLNNCFSKKIDVHIKDKEGYTPLHKAAEKGCLEEVRCFLKIKGANIEANTNAGLTPLHLAAAYGHILVVQLLRNQRANMEVENESGSTPLHLAALNGHLSVVQYLKSQGANTEAKTSQNETPLQLAILKGRLAVTQYLQYIRQEYRFRRSLEQQQNFLFHGDSHYNKSNIINNKLRFR